MVRMVGCQTSFSKLGIEYSAFMREKITDLVLHDPGGSKMRQVIACSPNPMDIKCPANHKIEIINGNYGRFTITLCNNQVRYIEGLWSLK